VVQQAAPQGTRKATSATTPTNLASGSFGLRRQDCAHWRARIQHVVLGLSSSIHIRQLRRAIRVSAARRPLATTRAQPEDPDDTRPRTLFWGRRGPLEQCGPMQQAPYRQARGTACGPDSRQTSHQGCARITRAGSTSSAPGETDRCDDPIEIRPSVRRGLVRAIAPWILLGRVLRILLTALPQPRAETRRASSLPPPVCVVALLVEMLRPKGAIYDPARLGGMSCRGSEKWEPRRRLGKIPSTRRATATPRWQ